RSLCSKLPKQEAFNLWARLKKPYSCKRGPALREAQVERVQYAHRSQRIAAPVRHGCGCVSFVATSRRVCFDFRGRYECHRKTRPQRKRLWSFGKSEGGVSRITPGGQPLPRRRNRKAARRNCCRARSAAEEHHARLRFDGTLAHVRRSVP